MIPPDRREEWIIRQARERPTAERAALLDGACAGDEASRQRLEARLAAHDQPETLASQAVIKLGEDTKQVVARVFSLLVAALSLGLPLAGATPELPSTPAGKVLAGYLEAVNSGNKDKLEAFNKAHRPDRPDALNRMLDLQ